MSRSIKDRIVLLDAASVETPLPLNYNVALSEIAARVQRKEYKPITRQYDEMLLDEMRDYLKQQGNSFIQMQEIENIWG